MTTTKERPKTSLATTFWRRSSSGPTHPHLSKIVRRRLADWLLFGVTSGELIALVLPTPTFTMVDWIYLLQHLMVLAIALTRVQPVSQDRSPTVILAVAMSYMYPYGQVIYLGWVPGDSAWWTGGLVLVSLSACLSLFSLMSLRRLFGVRPALRGLMTKGPYRFVRHPMYLAYVLSDIGYNLEEWNFGTLIMVALGWASLAYRIRAEERVLSQDGRWPAYISRVRYRLVPGLW